MDKALFINGIAVKPSLMPAEQTISVQRFSTRDIEARERYDAWHSRPSTFGSLFDTRPHEPFAAQAAGFAMGPLQIGFSSICSQSWSRTAAMARADGVDWLAVSVRFAGRADGDASDDGFSAHGSGSLFLDLAQPSAHFSEASETSLLLMPRHVAEAALGPVRALHGAVLSPAGSAMLRAQMRQLQLLAPHIPVDQGGRMAGVLLDLLAIGLAMEGRSIEVPGSAIDRTLKQRALAMIDARLGSATLTAANIARALGVSRSTLYRLFVEEGGIAACIRTRRLDRVHALLGDAGTIEPVVALAERWGFCDAAHFGRLFRERYGMTPGEYRAMRRAQRTP
ncbi:helix-turn-helix domain-containing protein [Sphingomonas sp. LT1P40]|uniref:helix-turn-helix domain-containing protein n=1 Tax=Alteristakelama amylovorans TaxID=3096166 RepID=UPI002FC7A0DA